ncbi:phosphoribosylformylglycinamidine synthase subunit PurS [Segniliparus rugosus]|uniref:Phosphoribosylformylglycinamidine synthase subunit PurS n=1 Tax=Segniliparus rugosus (strain ATCC BAA-974 / DSM 45345 / CCUG 50838 / CIP 108380 / JCM 13579 / CDC 945) TaxID=679197 RepID=E5XV28_SEGRC|nr:phosphoribosylformylglycinamidine synthase subunit PurS [Segniliparus rugosus]EFV11864.1 phosphoribosylformylglycinamidine synthase, purS protein [Segniliparus rugosus ATCC BAA-974]
MAKVVVHVMPKAELLDPQGAAVISALGRLGFSGATDVRVGKRFELTFDREPDEVEIRKIASTLLTNEVIEDYDFQVEVTA